MIEAIQSKLDEITAGFDGRINHCYLTATMKGDGQYRLTGAVLEPALLEKVTGELERVFSGKRFETGEVKILRPGRPLWVATSVTGLYAEPSFGREMTSQLLCGSAAEELMAKDEWSYVRQPDGYLGWVYRPYLVQEHSADPTHLACAPFCPLYSGPTEQASLVGRLTAGAAVRVGRQEGDWAQLDNDGGLRGWTAADNLRSLTHLPKNEVSRRQQMIADAAAFMGIPYLWGGTSGYGLDCSGYVQLLHRLVGIMIPRDADLQFAAGQPVEPPFEPGDLLFFGSPGGHRHISHVGLSLGQWHLIHSSRPRNGVHKDDLKEVHWLNDNLVGARTFLSQTGD